MSLNSQHCTACSSKDGKPPPLSKNEIEAIISDSTLCPSWTVDEDQGRIRRKFVAKNFKAAIKWINQVADIAEDEGHHPDLHVTDYRVVEIVIQTQSIQALTKNDFILAAKTDQVRVDYSPKWLRENAHVKAGIIHNS
uniref:4a-hydroxytetrahydrobiopterin dehydratase n=1 Tax=Mucochytrium quahogii TaxID=96639 RepID=A0A7S2SKC2_9STRA|mmetsp:Transcript_7052/g.11204  ORF Transcript_7052/g.11204 Transcript_7052/m.11204 type:complete len:138 (+) Transcript_7052:303-716(+)